MTIVYLQPEGVVLKNRIRRDMGDLDSLMESMSRYGLLTPIVVNRRHELIAGHRRLESAKRLGWSSIPAVVLEKESKLEKLELELEENLQRCPLSPEEISEGINRLEKLRNPGFFRRLWNSLVRWFRSIFGGRRDAGG